MSNSMTNANIIIRNLIETLRKAEESRPRVVLPFETEVYKEVTFDSAHLLPFHKDKCKFLHGHTYRLGVTLQGHLHRAMDSSEEGMVVDFKFLKEAIKCMVEDPYDHSYLNHMGFSSPGGHPTYFRTTAEQMSWFFFFAIQQYLNQDYSKFNLDYRPIKVVQVDLWETPTSRATAKRELLSPEALETFSKVVGFEIMPPEDL